MHKKTSAKKNRGGYSNTLADYFTQEQLTKLNGKKKSTKEKKKEALDAIENYAKFVDDKGLKEKLR